MNMDTVNDIMERATPVALHSPDHGPRHWRDVARIGLALWAEGVQCDLDVVLLFALLHDSQRENEYEDPDHGRRAAQVALLLKMDGKIEASDEQRTALLEALTEHDKGGTTDDPTIGTCWDADRLTLWRVGKVPDDDYLSTDQAKGKADFSRKIVAGPDIPWGDIVRAYENMLPTDLFAEPTNERAVEWLSDPMNVRNYVMLHRHFRGGELCDELKSCLHTADNGMKWLMHPFIHQPYFELEAAHYNDMLKVKRAHAREAFEQGDWIRFVFVHERPYRSDALIEVLPEIDDPAAWWALVASIWTDSENIWQTVDEWREIFENAPEGTMTAKLALESLDKLPDVLTVYRGTCAPDGMGCGMSWTLDREKAVWFARRLHIPEKHDHPRVITGTVEKRHVLGYMIERGEEEIVALPEHVTVTATTRVLVGDSADDDTQHTLSDPADDIASGTRSN